MAMATMASPAGAGGGGSTMTSEEQRLRMLMPPPPLRAPPISSVHLPGDKGLPKAVLPEDDYTAGVAAIIERDYFPDIPKLRNQLEWAQAVKSGDPERMRQAQLNIARRRAGLVTPLHAQTTSATPTLGAGATTNASSAFTAATPLGTSGGGWGITPAGAGTGALAGLRTPQMTPLVGAAAAMAAATDTAPHVSDPGATPLLRPCGATGASGSVTPGPQGVAALAAAAPMDQLRAPPMSLDTFLATHTSEDNASFAKLHAKDHAKKRRRVAHLLQDQNRPLLLEGPEANPTEGSGTGGQEPMTLLWTWHNPVNSLYYSPEQKPLSAGEALALAQRPAKAINVRGTRVKPAAADETEAAEAAAALRVAEAEAAARGREGAGQKLATPYGGLRPHSVLATPAMTPGGLGQSPLMTWGDIASTPLRLELEDPGVVFDPEALKGPTFSVPAQPRREVAGHQLAAAKTIKELRKRQREQREQAALPPGSAALVAFLGGLPASGARRPATGSGATPLASPALAARLGTPGRATTPLLSSMSEAAQRLAKHVKEQKLRMGAVSRSAAPGVPCTGERDSMLRATYSGLGMGGGSGTTVPAGAGAAGRAPGLGVAAAGGSGADRGARRVSGGAAGAACGGQGKSITDDLLQF